MQSSSPEQKKTMFLALAATSCMVLGVSSIMPLLPYLAKLYGVSTMQISLIITAFTLPGIFFAPIAGVLADRHGRKAVMVPSFILFSLAGGACAFAPDFTWLVALRFLQGIGAAPLGVLNTAIIADAYEGQALSRMIGYNMSLLSVCTALYPALGGFLGTANEHLPFLLPILFLPGAWLALRTPLMKPCHDSSLRQYFAELYTTMHSPIILSLLVMTFLTFFMLYGPIITGFPLLADRKFQASPATVGSIMVLFSIGSGIVSSQLGNLTPRFSTRSLFVASQCLYVVALLLIPFMPSLTWIIPATLLYGCAQGLNIPSIQAMLMKAAESGQRASIMAANGMLLRMGQTLAPLVFSALIDGHGVDMPFVAAIIVPLLLGFIALRFLPASLRKA